MVAQPASDVLAKSIIVQRDLETAFRIWTEKIGLWWPVSHSQSGDPQTQVFIEGRVNGRFYERTPAGTEYVWGKVIAWEPPTHFAYLWYRGFGQAQPTQVDIRFTAVGEHNTRVEIEHRGPELIGPQQWARGSHGFASAWNHVLTAYANMTSSTG